MKILITEKHLKKILNEQTKNSFYYFDYDFQKELKECYDKIVKAVEGPGTDPEGIYNSLKSYVITCDDFFILNRLFIDKKTGYSSFEEMINKEFEFDNYEDALRIKNFINSLKDSDEIRCIRASFSIGNSTLLGKTFNGNFKIDFSQIEKSFESKPFIDYNDRLKYNENQNVIDRYRNYIKEVKLEFKNYLSSSTFKQKFKNHWMANDEAVKYWVNKYFDFLNNPLEPVFYKRPKNIKLTEKEEETLNANAWVDKARPNVISFNMDRMNLKSEDEVLSVIMHEIQHRLYYIKPFVPDGMVDKIFKFYDLKKLNDNINSRPATDNTRVYNKIKIKNPGYSHEPYQIEPEHIFGEYSPSKLSNYERELYQYKYHKKRSSIRKSIAQKLYNTRTFSKTFEEIMRFIDNLEYGIIERSGQSYMCDENENLSRIVGVKKVLRKNLSQNLTLPDIEKLINWDNGSIIDGQLGWLLECWGKTGYMDLKVWINNLNSLVKNSNKVVDKNRPQYS